MEASFQVLDGSTVTLEGPFEDLSDAGATSFAVFEMGSGRQQEFGAGDRDFASDDAAELGITLAESYLLRGVGTIRAGSIRRGGVSAGFEEVMLGGVERLQPFASGGALQLPAGRHAGPVRSVLDL